MRKEREMSDAREALVALILERFRAAETYMDLPRQAGLLADAILAAGWTPPGEHVKPSLEQVVDVLAAQPPGRGEWTSSRIMQTARAVLALFPGRTEAEVKAEAPREAASAAVTEGEGIPWDDDRDRATVSAWLDDRAASIARGERS